MFFFLILALLSLPPSSSAKEVPAEDTLDRSQVHEAFQLTGRLQNPRNTFFPPLYSYLVPGLDQWIEGQTSYALTYSTLGVAGLALVSSSEAKFDAYSDLSKRDWNTRKMIAGNALYSVGAGLSAYHSFRTAAPTHWEDGEYTFLDPKYEETPTDLALAPFRFSYLSKQTTWIPLVALTGLVAADFAFSAGTHWRGLTGGDVATTAIASYGAGVGEEAAFRGWLLPWGTELTDKPFLGNAIQAAVFGLAHLASDNKLPLIQTAFGFYLGQLSQNNHYTLGEGIFIHTWWDVIAFAADYASTQKINLRITPLVLHF